MGQLVQQPAGSVVAIGPTADARQYLTFLLAGEMYAVAILNVKEIIEYGTLTEIPMMPAFIRGVINLRGAVVPVIDLAARFGGVRTAIGRRTCIVIIELSQEDVPQDVGIVVDAVSEVLEIPPAEIEPPPAFGARIRTDFIDGMGKVAGRFVVILDVGRVLSVDEMAALATVGESSKAAADAVAV
jgi:purine-binding chemotaxis protein CheW